MAKGARPYMSGEELLAQIPCNTAAERVILANANCICVLHQIFKGEDLYALMVEKLLTFGTLFQGHAIELSICMRDPGNFIPAAYGKSHSRSSQRCMAGAAPTVVQCSSLIHACALSCQVRRSQLGVTRIRPLFGPKFCGA